MKAGGRAKCHGINAIIIVVRNELCTACYACRLSAGASPTYVGQTSQANKHVGNVDAPVSGPLINLGFA